MSALSGGVQWNKPPGLICHICGREYGTASLTIHLPQCAKLWKDRQKLLPRKERRPVPKAPSGLSELSQLRFDVNDADGSIERFNKQQMDAFTSKALVQCQHCGRRFLEEKLPVHQRSCTADKPAAAVGSHRLKQPTEGLKGGAAAEEEMKVSETEETAIIVPSKGYDLSNLPEAEETTAGDVPMQPCSICGRRFNADRVAKHEAVCTGTRVKAAARPKASAPAVAAASSAASSSSKSARKWESGHSDFQQAIQYAKQLTAAQKAGVPLSKLPPPPPSVNADYVSCPHCQRRFNPTAAERHIPSCANTINKPKPPPALRRPTAAAATSTPAPASAQLSSSGGKSKAPPRSGSPVRAQKAATPAKGAGGAAAESDLRSQVQQLTSTVTLLAQQMNRNGAAAAGGSAAGAGSQCRSCASALPTNARFCSQCGSQQ